MVKMSVWDECASQLCQSAESLQAYAQDRKEYAIVFDTYLAAMEMLCAFEKNGSPDIALLDICMPGMLGTQLARSILQETQTTDIIFLTASSDYAVEAFSLHAADYIKKPYTEEQFFAAFDRVIALRQKRKYVLIPCEGGVHRIALEDILYIETRDKYREVFLVSGEMLRTRMSKEKFREQFEGEKSMVLCGASYFVNLHHVQFFKGQDMILEDGTRIPVPRRLKTQMKEAYFAYYLKEAGRGC